MTSLTCVTCGTVGKHKRQPKGHLLLEIVLYFFWIVPGIIYTIWRQTTYRQVCTVCGNDMLVPSDSPIAMSVRGQNRL